MDEVNLRAPHIWLTQAMKHTDWNFRKLKYKLPCPFSCRGRRGDGSASLHMPLWSVNTFGTQRYVLFPSCLSLSSQIAASQVNVMPWDLYVCDLGGQNLPVRYTLASEKPDSLGVPCLNSCQQTLSSSAFLSVGTEEIAFEGDPRF